jgi:nitrite reductase/ring-hydroxylating ferredoxin subunit
VTSTQYIASETETCSRVNGTYHRVARVGSLSEGQIRICILAGRRVLLIATDGEFVAILDRCPHEGARLNYGRVRRGAIVCPGHGAPFNLTTGACLTNLTDATLTMFPVRIVDGWIEVAVRDVAAET